MDERLTQLLAGLRCPPDAMGLAWLSCLWDMVDAGEKAVVALAGTAAGRRPLGRGKGGDVTVALDQAAEAAMLAVLRERSPAPHHLISEEAGELGGVGEWRVVVDPVDGSLNAKRGLEPYGTTLAVASGPSLRDVIVGVVADYPRGHRYVALAECGAVSTRSVDCPGQVQDVELILTEMGRPDDALFSFRDMGVLAGAVGSEQGHSSKLPYFRVRQMGSLALSLVHTALGVGDVLFCPAHARSVDIAGGLLFLREMGGDACAIDGSDLWAQPLDLERRAPFVAWRHGLVGPVIADRGRRLWGEKYPVYGEL